MASSDFLPDREAKLLNWSRSFSTLISQTPELFSLTPEQAAAYAVRNDIFADLFKRAQANSTRTPSIIVAKDGAKRELIAEARKLARIIRASPDVTNEQRVSLGLSVRDPGEEGDPARLPVPTAPPVLWIGEATMHRVKIRVRDKEHPTRRGRPRGVLGAMMFYYVGHLPPADDSEWRFHSQSTRTKMTLNFDGRLPSGSTVWLKARWINPRLQAGPFCDPRYAQLPGQLQAAATAASDAHSQHVKLAA